MIGEESELLSSKPLAAYRVSNSTMTKLFKIVSRYITRRNIVILFLFCYFGYICVPQWAHLFSQLFFIWLILLPIILITLVLVGSIGIVGIIRTKIKKNEPNPKHRFLLRFSLLSLVWFGATVAIGWGTNYLYSHQKFDSEKWLNSPVYDRPLSLRQRMVEDFTTNVLPVRTKEEIIKLLGEPDEEWMWEGKESFMYYIGYERGFGVDYHCLLIIFDSEGNYLDYEDLWICG